MTGDNMRNLTLLTDFYELTMMYGYFKQGKTNQVATFDVFFRPFEESNFCIAAGLQQAAEYLRDIRFGEEEREYLRSTGAFDEEFLQWLKDFRFTGSVKAVPEGTVVFLKTYRERDRYAALLRERGCSMVYGANIGLENEFVSKDPEEIAARPEEYLSMLLGKTGK